MNSIILIGFEDGNSNWLFQPVRGFALDDEGIRQARQYVNMLVEARPYDSLPLAKVISAGLHGDVPEQYSRDKAVQFGDLFPLDPAYDEALSSLRAQLAGDSPTCTQAKFGPVCVGVVRYRDGVGAFMCSGHADTYQDDLDRRIRAANIRSEQINQPLTSEDLTNDEANEILNEIKEN